MESKESYKPDYVDLLCLLDPEKLQLYDQLLFEQTLEVYPTSHKINTTNLTIDNVLKDVLFLIKK